MKEHKVMGYYCVCMRSISSMNVILWRLTCVTEDEMYDFKVVRPAMMYGLEIAET